MRIGIVSDTHGHVGFARLAVEVLKTEQVECVLHCGDIGSVEIVPLFEAWPTHFVFGNVDRDEDRLRREIAAAGQTCHGRFGELEWDGVKIALLHSDDADRFHEAMFSGEYDLVCYGHTHQADQRQIGRTLVLNPGALYRATPHSLAVVELPSLDVRIIPVG
ncbi:MAG: YfcE family phosphodiesterase [Planctomycetaceae bacterium]